MRRTALFGTARSAANFRYGALMLAPGAGGYAWEFLPVAGDSLTGKGGGSCNRKRAA